MRFDLVHRTAGARDMRAPAGLASGVAASAAIGLSLCYLPLTMWGMSRGPFVALLGGLAAASLVASYLAYLRARVGCAWETLGVVAPSRGDVAWGIAAGLTTLALDISLARLFPDALLAETNKLPPEFVGPAAFLALCVMAASAALAEELVFRAYLIPALTARYDWKRALLASSLLFGLLHFPHVGAKTLSALVLGGVFISRRSLWPALIGHLLHNLVGYGAAFHLIARAA